MPGESERIFAMTLQEACSFLNDIAQVPVTILSNGDSLKNFCSAFRFHPIQDFLAPDTLGRFLEQISCKEIVHLTDVLGIHFIFTATDDSPVVLGPFCTELLTVSDCCTLFHGLPDFHPPVDDYLAYRSPFPVMPDRQALYLTRCLMKNLGINSENLNIREIDGQNPEDWASLDGGLDIHRPYGELIKERYATEQLLMENICLGNRFAAIANWRALHNYVAYTRPPKSIGYTIENARISATITRTVIRIAAIRAGIPAALNDRISGKSAAIIRKASTIEEIDKEHERLISEYCHIIYDRRTKGYSGLVLSAIYHMEHHFSDTITVAALAKELDVSPNYLTSRFRRETGLTPTAYLTKTRMGQAARRLISTRLSVHQISEQVGILDSNYFVKLFKKEFGVTPGGYRTMYRL